MYQVSNGPSYNDQRFLGYVQGMSDLLSPILVLMEDEVDSFWCFCGLMEMEAGNFELVQHFMQTQLANLGLLIKFFYPQFYHYLGEWITFAVKSDNDVEQMHFCEEHILSHAPKNKRPFIWNRFTDDIFMVWRHGAEALEEF